MHQVKKNHTIIIILLAALLASACGCSSLFSYLKDKRDRNYQEGISLYENKEYGKAKKKFETVVSIDPEYKKARTYLNRTTAYLNRLEKRQKLEEQKKLREIKRRYDAAVVMTKRSKYEEALAIFLEIYKEEPYYEDIQDLMDICREKLAWKYEKMMKKAQDLARKKEHLAAYSTAQNARKYNPEGREAESLMNEIERELDKKIKPMKSNAEKLYARKNFEAAKSVLKKALAVKPWDDEIPAVIARCDRMIGINDQFNDAMNYYRKKDYYTAYLKMQSVNRQEPGYRNCEAHIEALKNLLGRNINTYYSSGLKHYEQNNFQAAIGEWNKVLTIDPNHEKARYYRERAAAKLDMQKSLAQ